ncbi:MAG: hypothetical protein LUC17_03070, partial [Oscillospiraceae bacterium]|nr:hypothetical protein [Oscillospiraceae bacterium]
PLKFFFPCNCKNILPFTLKKITVYDWMYRELGLKGDVLMVYAALYGAGEKKILLSDSPALYGYMKMNRSSYFRVRANLLERGLLEITEEEGVRYFYVPRPDFTLPSIGVIESSGSRLDSAAEIEGEIPDEERSKKADEKLSDKRDTVPSERAAQLDFLGMTQGFAGKTLENPEKTCEAGKVDEAGMADEAAKENEPEKSSVDKTAPSVDNLAPFSGGDVKSQEKILAEKEANPKREDVEEGRARPMTKEEFCEKMHVEYDGTENTEGMDWDVLYKAYSESEYLRNFKIAHILKNIPFKYEEIKSGKYSDEYRAKMAKLKDQGD